ncbi:glucose-1-phosphate adenylyltransferase [Anaerotalea alkaliphila]|uniref:Glucose-1-phosphate adenylyltransferase n=1 Tax=Anaerotalea alkaliphila TaxID=2662126 RepID=A0A7X5HTH2_9FIRM|nr:glucose-1-phosphate adenylyltransferase [Anaerotalea alkaliphila]NDL66351.1 glucose-1-phosphate adenylyltransferase [Anaerotalea alkaliphila]
MVAKEMVALLLAGGQGSRLGVLTTTIAKPAVSYGGKYRIIDFPLSNCVNSDIDTVGVFTQYQPLELNTHIGIGKPWDLDRVNGGVTILSPYLKADEGEWFKGTANAVCQNIHYVDKINPEYVIILSGDHIYKMDYSRMLDFHKQNNADATISVLKVPLEDASRFGIMNADENNKIYEFEEKPKNPKSDLASMGVYIFTWPVLREYLLRDDKNPDSDNDFGKNIIPMMLGEGRSMYAYAFEGYWKDVGTIQAYWESNMDLIERVPEFNLFDRDWRIYTSNPVKPAHYIAPSGSAKKSIIAEGCLVYGTVRNSILFPGVVVEEGAVIQDSIIMSNTRIGRNVEIYKSILSEDVQVGHEAKIGIGEDVVNEDKPHIYDSGITVIGDHAVIPNHTEIGKNVVVEQFVTTSDFTSKVVPSGKSVIKGGVENE